MSGSEGSNRKTPCSIVFDIEIHRITCADFLHEFSNTAFTNLLEKQMEMIRHEAVRTDCGKWFPSFNVEYFLVRKVLDFSSLDVCSAVRKIQCFLKTQIIRRIFKCCSFVDTSRVAVIPLSGYNLTSAVRHKS